MAAKKLSPAKIRQLREDLKKGKKTRPQIAAKYGVSVGTVQYHRAQLKKGKKAKKAA